MRIFVFLLLVCCSWTFQSLFAQFPPPPPPAPLSGGGGGPTSAPIDGGAVSLLLMGAAYGSYKIREKRKQKTSL
jgi:hypothetical protein